MKNEVHEIIFGLGSKRKANPLRLVSKRILEAKHTLLSPRFPFPPLPASVRKINKEQEETE